MVNNENRKEKKIELGTIIFGCLIFIVTVLSVVTLIESGVFASSTNYTPLSKGRLINEADGSIIFDAEDMTTLNNNIGLVENSVTAINTSVTGLNTTVEQLHTDVENAKIQLTETIKTYSNAEELPLVTFEDMNTAVDTLTKWDNTNPYYYDVTTGTDNASEIKRYKKVDGQYYLCNRNGEITDQDAQVVELNNLAQYEAATQENLTAGTAIYINKTLYLGDNSDNISYYNAEYERGYNEGYADGQNNTGEIVYTYHTHNDGYCNQVPVYHQHTGQSGACYTPIYCGASLRQADENNGYKWFCNNYDGQEANFHWFGTTKPTENGGRCPHIDGYSLVCGKTTSTIDSYKCDIPEGSIVSATIVFH